MIMLVFGHRLHIIMTAFVQIAILSMPLMMVLIRLPVMIRLEA